MPSSIRPPRNFTPPISFKWWCSRRILLHHWLQNPWKWGGGSLQNPKKKTQFWWEHPCNLNPKPKPGQALKTFKFSAHTGKVNQKLKSQTPPYLPNGDSVGKCFYIIQFITLENGGVGCLQIPKKEPQWGQNAHQTQKPQISYILQTSHF
jgi:hypothetical protein